ncbi:MAG TPA: response regulator [Mucilaginibacter sp.]|jgi:response regulator of citrate/malate metabolism|nr:response regulator [Mucilaginibacter sp.]
MSKIILIDDDPIYQKISQIMVKEYSHVDEIVTSGDGKDTLDYLIENRENTDKLPDYIFLDINMPEFNGWDFLNGYKKIYHSLRKAIGVYIVSSSIDPNDIKRSYDYSFVKKFILKPLNREFLNELLA